MFESLRETLSEGGLLVTGKKRSLKFPSDSNPSLLPAGCELYAFCGALFGICSMITMTVIAIDRYFVITRPLTSIGVLSRKRALFILVAAWAYSLGWSLPPFFGWSEDTRHSTFRILYTTARDSNSVYQTE